MNRWSLLAITVSLSSVLIARENRVAELVPLPNTMTRDRASRTYPIDPSVTETESVLIHYSYVLRSI